MEDNNEKNDARKTSTPITKLAPGIIGVERSSREVTAEEIAGGDVTLDTKSEYDEYNASEL